MGPVSTTSTTTDGLPPSTGATTAQAVIDLGAIAHNVKLLREHAGTARLMTVVKADGYGHGAVRVARAALAAGADELGVTSIAEALQIRAAGLDAPLLAWLHAPGADYAAALHADVEVAVSSLGQLGELLAAARSTGRQAITSIKVDTGLNRNGVPAGYTRDLFEALAKAQAEESIRLRGIMSHFAYADQPGHPTVDMQIGRFNEALELARGFGLRYELAHLSNSAATLTRPDARYDMVRPGIAVYGINLLGAAESATSNRGRTSFDLIPAMSLTCAVSSVKPVSAGEGVSYGHVWTAPRDTNAALIGIGYADGVVRALGNRFEVAIGGRRYPNIGRVCMDQFVVDLGDNDAGVQAGDVATLFGPGTGGEPTAQDWAELLDTIAYEVVTGPRGRVVRTYRDSRAVE
ncbi:Alanine racemase [Mycobacteroides abscessus subsp. abscessus]|uniref:alanine racemase n=1 Tax=Mycobacteroides abscessus TaxID=36809 RepID=UPI00092807E1|nr:alanine racemase [Mycobacteroides abscessus]SHO85397.1 Alanine racemase [Mycobacteroides abscessus subsp. abscessus]SHP69128.1 Alanine racemase [Mycobacteroides abscessus subsp. abscessus]SHP84578.1 Alanine racemase [Mycobacteroides abscessus subsp. abscessus]SHQ06210.1 Alanine racemase [Mycobacteroides abscessus subsp. abscessus]SHR79256.1 Alanine racemase [Mycobacteroides abscessus subsp. abscessus]